MAPPETLEQRKKIEFVIVDVAYGSGRTSSTRITRKQLHYATLVKDLRDRGFTVHGFDEFSFYQPGDAEHGTLPGRFIGVISLGSSGELYASTQSLLSCFDLNAYEIDKLLKELHLHSVNRLRAILNTRYMLDRSCAAGPLPAGHPPTRNKPP